MKSGNIREVGLSQRIKIGITIFILSEVLFSIVHGRVAPTTQFSIK